MRERVPEERESARGEREYQRRAGGGGERSRGSWEAGGAAFDGQDPPRETGSQTWDIAPQLHPAITAGGGEEERRGEEGRGEGDRKSTRLNSSHL